MTEELITDLSQLKGVKVLSRKSAMRYRKTDKAVPQIAQELGVEGIIEGSVRRFGDRVRVSVQLIYAATETQVWAQSYEKNVKDALAVQSEVANDIAGQIRANMQFDQRAQVSRPANQKAQDAYLRGIYQLGKEWHARNPEAAVRSFRQAIAEDPNFALAYVKLAEAYPGTSLPNAVNEQRTALKKALSLDPDLAEAHYALANLQLHNDYNFAGAEREYKRAIALSRNSAYMHDAFAAYLNGMGRFDEALR